jgi:hypothetical protein
VTDNARSEEPEMLLTGDLLFLGDIIKWVSGRY